MFINEVEHIVGLSKKSIRYYEENGLLSPKRNKENDYRIYSEDDIKTLKIIKFLRELGVTIKELQELQSGSLTLQECMKERIKQIDNETAHYEKAKNICLEFSKSDETFLNINIEKYFEAVNILNKEGFTMRNTKTNKTKKIVGATISSLIFGILILFIPIMISYFQFTESTKIPWIIYIILIGIFAIPTYGIVYNLVTRIKEINGGEEDEASKY